MTSAESKIWMNSILFRSYKLVKNPSKQSQNDMEPNMKPVIVQPPFVSSTDGFFFLIFWQRKRTKNEYFNFLS